jgi:predicted transcriptional regulator
MVNGSELRDELGLSYRQYYAKIRPMLKMGLLEKKDGVLSLTKLGTIVFQAQSHIENAINKYWELKAIDSIENVPEMDKQEAIKIMKKLAQEKTRKFL